MPFNYEFDLEHGIIVMVASCWATLEECAACVQALICDVEMPLVAPILIDSSQRSSNMSAADISKKALLTRDLAQRFNSRIAYFVTGVGLVTPYALASFIANLEGVDVHTFTSREEAIAWLKEGKPSGF